MSLIGNILWFLCGGVVVAALYFVAGLFMCITIVGIPFGLQLWKVAGIALCPFGKEVTVKPDMGCLSTVFSLLWVVFGWWEIAIVHLVFAFLTAITIIGIPFAKAHWRLMKMSLAPFAWERKKNN